jgi:hypothetical protein
LQYPQTQILQPQTAICTIFGYSSLDQRFRCFSSYERSLETGNAMQEGLAEESSRSKKKRKKSESKGRRRRGVCGCDAHTKQKAGAWPLALGDHSVVAK